MSAPLYPGSGDLARTKPVRDRSWLRLVVVNDGPDPAGPAAAKRKAADECDRQTA